MAKFNFNLKHPKSTGHSAISLIIRFNCKKLKFGIGETIKPSDWNPITQRAKESRSFPEYPEFNFLLDNIEATAKTVFRAYLSENNHKEPSPKVLKELLEIQLRGKQVEPPEKQLSFYDFVEKHIEESKTKVNSGTGKVLSKYTILMYKQTLKRIREFSIKEEYRVDFETITLDFYDGFTDYLSKDVGMSKNSVGRHIKTLKAWLSEATEKGYNKNLIFKSKKFKKTTEISESVYLTFQELEEIENLDLTHNPKLDRVRDYFIVAAYSGLRSGDLSNLKKENIKENTIEVITAKTSERVVIPIHKSIRKVLNKYKGVYENCLPPSMSNANFNKYIKEVCQLVDSLHCDVQLGMTKGGKYVITKYKKFELCSLHTARRSFATNWYKLGVNPLTIRTVTGHRSTRVFESYVKLSVDQHADILNEEWTKRGLM